jgi:hypothetical protein
MAELPKRIVFDSNRKYNNASLFSSQSHTLYKAAKLTFTDSYLMLIANLSDFDNVHFKSFRQSKCLGAAQSFSVFFFSLAAG